MKASTAGKIATLGIILTAIRVDTSLGLANDDIGEASLSISQPLASIGGGTGGVGIAAVRRLACGASTLYRSGFVVEELRAGKRRRAKWIGCTTIASDTGSPLAHDRGHR